VGLAVSILGLAAYLYLLGGLVWWLRFTAARLPADQAVSAIGSKRLLTTGLKAFLFEAVILAVLMVLALGAWQLAKKVSKGSNEDESPAAEATSEAEAKSKEARHRPIAWSTILFGICLGIEILAVAFESKNWARTGGGVPSGALIGGAVGAFAAALFDESSDRTQYLESAGVRWALSIPLAAGAIVLFSAPAGVAILVLLVLAHLSGGLNELPSVDDPLELVPAVLIVGIGFGLVAAAYEATPPVSLERVTVVPVAGQGRGFVGGYVGESSDGLIVAQCRSNPADPKISPQPPRLKAIPKGHIQETYLGGPRYAFDYGKKPSILDLLKHYTGHGEVDEAFDTVSIDPRRTRLVCGDARSFRVVTAVSKRKTGTAKERVIAHGAGVVSVGGQGVETTQITLDRGDEVWLPIVPVDAARAEVGLLGQTVVRVWTRFELESGDTDTSFEQVHLMRRKTF